VLPQLADCAESSLFLSLHSFLSHPWHHHLLFAGARNGKINLSPETVLHLLASSIWATNLRILDRQVKRVSFEDVRHPSLSTNETLHRQRAEIKRMLDHVTTTLEWLPPLVRNELAAMKDDLPASKYIGFPDDILKDVLRKTEDLEKFLVDTFTLLLSSISISEACMIREQARQGQMLTRLAFSYVPLSFVTSVFGMNVQEINGSPLPIWVCVAALAVTGTCTFGVFAIWRCWQCLVKAI
jgi:Mg2+ and Co2+ transporter CorA